jgi:hypothetical protein
VDEEPEETSKVEPSTEDPSKAELESLRREKREREQAERDAKDKELEELRAFKADKDKPPTVPAPAKKVDKEPKTDEAPKPVKKARVSSKWFGASAHEE